MSLRFLPVLFFLISFALSSQNNFGIKIPKDYYQQQQECTRIRTIFQNKPKEIGFSVHRDHKNTLYLNFNNKKWFQNLFENPYDGIAVDIVNKKQFACNAGPIEKQIRGQLLKPVYTNILKRSIETVQQGYYQVKLGQLPERLTNQELEFNMVFLSNRNLCRYQTTYNIQSYNYQLLDMGMYLDSIAYDNASATLTTQEGIQRRYKTLEFTVPFKKNKATFSSQDIKPVYDSLRLTDFNIKKIEILAYSSIEGTLENNSALQKKRSESIINALQSFQKPTIQTDISTSENWVEFLNDISDTEYDNLKSLTKKEIKEKVNNGLEENLEVYLKNHRKALIKLYLDKIDSYASLSGETLVMKINDALSNDNLTQAEKLQNSLFHKMKSKEVSPELLYELDIPKQKKFVDFFNSTSAFRYELDRNNLLSAYYEFQEINKWAPDNKKVAYNMLALKLRINHSFKSIPEEGNLVQKIKGLEKLGIDKSLVDRMMVNYHITKSELLLREGLYEEKDESVAYILETYKKFELSDADYLSLAQYLTYYFDRETAIALLQNKVDDINVKEKLLFYYLNLTIIDDNLVEKPAYRKIMLNAIAKDKKRFCKLFDPNLDGGVTFQLLDNPFLKRTYCENCSN